MRLKRALIENYRAITRLELDLHPQMNVFFGGNAKGKTTVLNAIAVGLGSILQLIPAVSAIGFRKKDRRGVQPARVALEAIDGTRWERIRGVRRMSLVHALKERLEPFIEVGQAAQSSDDLPIVAFYDTERAIRDQQILRRRTAEESPRQDALQGSLSAGVDFSEFLRWFRAKEHEELGLRNERKDFLYETPDLHAVRAAIRSMVPGIRDVRIAFRPLRFEVRWQNEAGDVERLALSQLSDGYRVMLALAADLARRMAQGNPHLPDPLQSEAIVLIDEVELHLHPSWQQSILPDLMRTFPQTQFLVSTHSPQVLTTVEPDCVIELEREDGEIVAGGVVSPTFGAEAARVLTGVMKVDQRPADNDFARGLSEYYALIAAGRGEAEEAEELRRQLEAMSPRDRGLDRARMEINRRRVLRRMGRTP